LEVQFSGVIPAYNHERFIYSAIASLAEQVDEVVVVDDNSSDKTWMEIERAKLEFPNVRSLRNSQNLGVSDCVNRAVESSKGRLLFFLGSDDEALQGRVQRQTQVLSNPSVSISASIPKVINDQVLSLTAQEAQEFRLPKKTNSVAAELFLDGNFICAPSIAMGRDTWEKLGGYRRGLPNLHDYDFVLRSTSLGTVNVLSDPVVSYRKHALNLSSSWEVQNLRQESFIGAEKDFILFDFVQSLSREALIDILSLGPLSHKLLKNMNLSDLVHIAVQSSPSITNEPTPTRTYFELLTKQHPNSLLVRGLIKQIEEQALDSF